MTYLLMAIIAFFSLNAEADENSGRQENPSDTRDEMTLEISIFGGGEICYQGTGTLIVYIDEGTPPYDYQWNTTDTGNQLNDVPAGTYTVTVTDGNGDQAVESATLTELPALSSVFTMQVNDLSCHGSGDGSINTGFTNDTGPYSYAWSNGASSANVTGLDADTYFVTITDAYGCEMDTSAIVEEPDTLLMDVYSKPANCFGSMDGMAWVDVSGGIPVDTTPQGFEYNYHWPNPAVDNDTIQYYGGNYTLTVSDANGCTITEQFSIDQPPQMIATQAGNPTICIGQQANLESEVTGGTAPYSFLWAEASTMDTLLQSNDLTVSPVETNSYYFVATDANGCTSNVVNSTVTVYPELQITSLISSADSICPGEPLNVEVEVDGGNGVPYQLPLLNSNQIVASPFTIYPEQSDSYTIRLQDACTTPAVEASFDVTVMPLPPAAFNVNEHESCPPGTFRFNEFSPDVGQSYYWDFGDDNFSFDKSPSHTYSVPASYDVSMTAASSFGCEKTITREDLITIHPKPDAEFYASTNNTSILNPNIQFFNVSNNADSIYWFFGDGDSTLQSRENPWHSFEDVGSYSVKMIATNIHGCSDTAYNTIYVRDNYTFNVPQAFTPNNDGVNDCFRICAHGIDPYEFEFYVYDRYGSIVFETTQFENDKACDACGDGAWDGTYNGSLVKGDKLCKPGMYYWYCKYTDAAGVESAEEGRVQLIR